MKEIIKSKKNYSIFLIAFSQTILWAGLFYSFPALLLQWEEYFGLNKLYLTGIYTLSLLISGFVAPIVGNFIDRGLGPIIISFSALSGGLLLYFLQFSNNFVQFSFIWFLLGISMGGCLYEPCFSFLIRTLGNEAKSKITLVTLFAGFASTLSFPICYFISREFGWANATNIFSILIVFMVTPLIWIGTKNLEDEYSHLNDDLKVKEDHFNWEKILRNKIFWLLAFSFSVISINHGVIISHIIPILSFKNFASEFSIWCAAVIGPMQVLGRLVLFVVDKKINNYLITLVCFVSLCVGPLFLFISEYFIIAIFIFVFLQGASYGISGILKPIVLREMLGKNDFGKISGALAVPVMISTAFAPFLGSIIWKFSNYNFVILSLVILGVIGLYIFILANRLSVKELKL